jgi:DNA modification methylase
MTPVEQIVKGHKTAESRWARFGPYYAMFPVDFAFDVIEKHSQKSNYIIDPFAGRCSTVFAGNVLERNSIGIEINPVGALYGKVKLQPASKEAILARLENVFATRNSYHVAMQTAPEFFHMCFCDDVLKFLFACRDHLDWKNDTVDATLMAIILVYLHGKLGEGLSNQMKMTKAMGMTYSVKWWKEHELENPPKINPYDFLKTKIEWRYATGVPKLLTDSHVVFGDSTIELKNIIETSSNKCSLLFTSPPYCSITDYHTDQWLRLWMLGGNGSPLSLKEKYKGRFVNKQEYYVLLDTVFGLCAKIMEENAVIYVRTDTRKFTQDTTIEILSKHFPRHKTQIIDAPVNKRTQTDVLGNKSSKKGEVDIMLYRE